MKKRLLSVALIGAMLCSLLVVPAFAKSFPDADGHWAQGAIETWSERGVVNGDDAGNFRPGDSITRAETAKLIDNLIGFQKTSNKVFSDVSNDAWYASSINKLYAAGVMTGYEDGTIRPGNSISRQEAAVIIGRAFALETKKVDTGILANFADNDQIQDWAKPVVAFMANKGFIQGSDGLFRPGDPITRAEVVTILNNMVGVYADGSQSTYTGNFGDKIAIIKAPTVFNGVTLGGAVVCGTTKGKVNFNSGSKINGCVCNWAPNGSVSTAGATVTSTANKGGGTISAGGNFGAMTGATNNAAGGGSMGGGSVGGSGGSAGGSSAGGSSSNQFSVVFNGNGGVWEGGRTQQTVYYTNGNSYALRMPSSPTRTGYTFDGWYKTQAAANALISTQKLNALDIIVSTSPKTLFAGWKNPNGLYGAISVATDADLTGRGKSAADLMKGVTLTNLNVADTYKATGSLRYATGQWNSPSLDPEGNFLALTYTLPEGVVSSNVILSSKFSDNSSSIVAPADTFLNGKKTYTRIFKITSADLAKDIIFTIDLVGDHREIGTITIDLANLVCCQFVTVATPAEFATAVANPAVEKITVDAPITLASGTYGTDTRKPLVVKAPISIEKDATVTLKNLDISIDATVPALFSNTTEVPEGETEAVATKAQSLTMEGVSLSGTGILNNLLVKALVIKNSALQYAGDSTAPAISLATPTEGDTVSITNTTFNDYYVALEAQNATLFDGNAVKNNIFKNNVTDIKLGVADAIPNLSYNYFDGEPVIAGTEGAITNYVGPIYTAEAMQNTDLPENLHDAYVMAADALMGKLSALTGVEVTFESEDDTCEIRVIPADVRDTTITINTEAIATVTLGKADLPKDLSIVIGNGEAKVISVTEAAELQ